MVFASYAEIFISWDRNVFLLNLRRETRWSYPFCKITNGSKVIGLWISTSAVGEVASPVTETILNHPPPPPTLPSLTGGAEQARIRGTHTARRSDSGARQVTAVTHACIFLCRHLSFETFSLLKRACLTGSTGTSYHSRQSFQLMNYPMRRIVNGQQWQCYSLSKPHGQHASLKI